MSPEEMVTLTILKAKDEKYFCKTMSILFLDRLFFLFVIFSIVTLTVVISFYYGSLSFPQGFYNALGIFYSLKTIQL